MVERDKYSPPPGYDLHATAFVCNTFPVVADSSGKRWVDVNGTMVMHIPRPTTVEGFVRVVKGLLRRLNNAVQSNIRISADGADINDEIILRKSEFDAVPADDAETRQARGARLAGAYLSAFTREAENYMAELLKGNHSPKDDKLGAYMAALRKHAKYMRLRDGSKDNDAIIAEAIGEGPMAMPGVIAAIKQGPQAGAKAIELFYRNRYAKIAEAKNEVSLLEAEMLDTIRPNAELDEVVRKNTGGKRKLGDLAPMIRELAAATGELLETPYTMNREFGDAWVKFEVCRDRLTTACLERYDTDPIEKDTFRHVMEGVKLMNATATYRLAMPVSVTGYMAIRAIGKASTKLLYMLREEYRRPTEMEDIVIQIDAAAKNVVKEFFHFQPRTEVMNDFYQQLERFEDIFSADRFDRMGARAAKIAAFARGDFAGFLKDMPGQFPLITIKPGDQSVPRSKISEFRDKLAKDIGNLMARGEEIIGNTRGRV